MSNQIKLQQPIINGSLRATNFFNGRLVTGADLTREQNARREAVRRVGQAAGEGIVNGLEVQKDSAAGSDPIVNVSRGLAVNRCGQALYLSQDTNINLLQRFGAFEQPSKIFGDCQPIQPGTYTAGYGLYLLVVSPAESSEGSAPTSGLNNAFASCNTDVVLETAQFRLLAIDPFLSGETLPSANLLRNYIAYRCFGIVQTRKFYVDPSGFALDKYGLIDEMRTKTLADCDVPLAIINWTSSGIQFVEMWAVRRRLTKINADKNWTQLIGDRRASETEAMMHQFADHIESLESVEKDLTKIKAIDRFDFLPPAGLLPITFSSSNKQSFDTEVFFGNVASADIALLEGRSLRSLLDEAKSHEPVDLPAEERIQLYYIRENLEAFNAKETTRLTLVFASHTMSYRGAARFGAAEFDLSRFAPLTR